MPLPEDPLSPSPRIRAMREAATLPRALMGGTAAMQAEGARFLPRHPAESPEHWQERLKRSVLRNVFARTVEVCLSRILGDGPEPDPAQPPDAGLQALFDDLDGGGRSLHQVLREAAEHALIDGVSYLLIDRAAGRPRVLPLSIWQVAGLRLAESAADPHPLSVRIEESTCLPAGVWGERQERRARIITRESWQLLGPGTGAEKRGWSLLATGANPIQAVPLVPVYTARIAPWCGRPPLLDLAWMNLEHWQIRSDQRNALAVASFPLLAASGWQPAGGEAGGGLAIGPNRLFASPDPQAKLYYVESAGAHLAAARAELQDLEAQMRAFGLQFEIRQAAGSTATARAIDAAEAAAPLRGWARNLEDAAARMLDWLAAWTRLAEGTAPAAALIPGLGGRLRLSSLDPSPRSP